VRPLEFARSLQIRRTLLLFGVLACAIALSFAIVYLQVKNDLIAVIDGAVTAEANRIAAAVPEQRIQMLEERLRQDPRRIKPGGLFDAEGRVLAGNIETLPPGLRIDGTPHDLSIVRHDAFGRERQDVRAASRALPTGETLVIGYVDENEQIAELIKRGLAFGLVPALCLALAAAALFSMQAQKQVEEVNARVQRIIAGDLRQRLPTQGTDEPLDKLAAIFNGMLDEIQELVQNLANVGDNIAHDLRTPLTRVRISLERALGDGKSLADLQAAVHQGIAGVDHATSIVTALLRIREIEQTRRVTGFGDVRLEALVRAVCDLYQPLAEEKNIKLSANIEAAVMARGDRDLLFEALANLVDNAVKYTPEGGHVGIALTRPTNGDAFIRVSDTGPGVPESERHLIMQRFYRSERSRHTKGLGLGLSLVAAIVKLHGLRFSLASGPGFVAEIAFPSSCISGFRPVEAGEPSQDGPTQLDLRAGATNQGGGDDTQHCARSL